METILPSLNVFEQWFNYLYLIKKDIMNSNVGGYWVEFKLLFKITPPYSTELNRGGSLSFQVIVTSNQLWNTHYSDYQTYLYNRITELKQEGLGYRKIAKLLNAEGVRTARNKEFLPASVHSILKKKKIRETRINREFNKEVSALELQYIDL